MKEKLKIAEWLVQHHVLKVIKRQLLLFSPVYTHTESSFFFFRNSKKILKADIYLVEIEGILKKNLKVSMSKESYQKQSANEQ